MINHGDLLFYNSLHTNKNITALRILHFIIIVYNMKLLKLYFKIGLSKSESSIVELRRRRRFLFGMIDERLHDNNCDVF